jgi:TonB family protein
VRDHTDQIRYCYESELQRSPGLAGKVTLEWMIAPSGAVTSARSVESALPRAVSSCLEEKVRGWRFPKLPPGMGAATIRYPFIFNRAG